MRIRTGIALVFLAALTFVAAEDGDSKESVIEQLVVETLVKPETGTIRSETGDTLQIHYTGRLMDGKVIDTSLSREPLVVELGKRSVITGLEQALVGLCEGQKNQGHDSSSSRVWKERIPSNHSRGQHT
ncbi:peptidyl-prolyl cis-trans isomerase FKBP11-like [Carassius carassius]|uniref:peptidyl-prolyl cis-trans isomerase FKBP11-like n=1 Tax=Carassius carassius TaxID=217509 RepID=UPI002868DE00|nr:peptidyl-prolyl cis-trans isomerase FKBP11-like [Carassius carassius]